MCLWITSEIEGALTMEQNKGEGRVRLFVGGLSAEVSAVDLKERFAPLGTVLSVTTPPGKHGSGTHRGFAYLDFVPTSEGSLRKLFSAYNGCKWRGGVLRIEGAKEHYVNKLQKEWAAEAEALAAKEVERLRKKSDVSSKPAPNQPKSWPLLLLEQPEKPDKWNRKREFEQGAESDGIKIFFPRLKKVKTVPSKGLGKHKRSFQRVESLHLQQLSTCDCDESLRTGSCDCSIAQSVSGDAENHVFISGEYDAVSLEIANERQRQLELLSRLFPSDSPRNSNPAMDLTTSLPVNGAEMKKGATTELTTDDSERRPFVMRTSSLHVKNADDSRELVVPVGKRDSRKDAAEIVEKRVHEPEILPLQTEIESPEIQADEPEMWVSFMNAMPLPMKTEENVSESDSDELSEETDKQGQEVSQANEAPAPNRSLRRQTEIETADVQADELEMWVSFMDAMPLPVKTQENVSESDSDELSEETEKQGLEVSQANDAPPPKRILRRQTEVESPNVQADEPEMWVSFMDAMPVPVRTDENVSELDSDELSETEEQVLKASQANEAPAPKRIRRLQTEVESPEMQADEPEMWVRFTDTMPLPVKTQENQSELDSDEPSETEAQLLQASQANEALAPKEILPLQTEVESVDIQADEPEMLVSTMDTLPLPVKTEENLSEFDMDELSKTEQTVKASQATEAPVLKRNELTRATWKSLVGETGRVVFSLQQVLGGNSTHVNQARGETIDLEDYYFDEKSGGSEAAKEKDVTSSGPITIEPAEKKSRVTNTAKSSLKFRKDFLGVDVTPPVPLFTDNKVCSFMKSPDAEKEWLATKSELRTDYRSKHKQAVKKSKKLRGR